MELHLNCDDGASEIAESRKSPSTIAHRTIKVIRNDLRSSIYETKNTSNTKRRRNDTRNEDPRRYAKRRRNDTRNEDEMIRAAVRNLLAKARPRDCMNETIHDDEDSAIRDERSKTIRDKGTIRHVTAILKTMGARCE